MIGTLQGGSADTQQAEREAQQVQANRAELVARLGRAAHKEGVAEPLTGVQIFHASAPTELGQGMTPRAFCVIAQGSKEVLLGDACYRYDPAHYFIATASLPVASRVAEASPEHPYLNFVLALDPALVGSVMVEIGHAAPRANAPVRALDVSPLDAGLLDAVVRLVRMLDTPADAHFLAPHITREIVYRLLKGAQGGRLGQVSTAGGGHRIAVAVERLRRDFDRPLRIDDLASDLGMSVSGFYQHFKDVTAMSPLQFQKQLRLQEARRLLLTEDVDAASAGRRVGYDDTSHFTREYKRLFGAPPLRHAEQMRDGAWASVGI